MVTTRTKMQNWLHLVTIVWETAQFKSFHPKRVLTDFTIMPDDLTLQRKTHVMGKTGVDRQEDQRGTKTLINLHTYLIYILNWPLHIGAFQGQWNTTKGQNRTTTTVKNPNWLEANQLAIYKCSWEVEPGTTRIKFNEWSERVLNPGSPDLKASALTTGPHCLF